jgi:hypothetical protein
MEALLNEEGNNNSNRSSTITVFEITNQATIVTKF